MELFTAEDKRKMISQGNCFTPKQVSNILEADLGKLKQLCKEHNVAPQKDFNSGKTFFLQKDVEFLQSLKELHQKSRQISEEEKVIIKVPQKAPSAPAIKDDNVRALVGNILEAQDAIVDRLSKVIDEKLDGMDDVIVELIRAKTENEKLKQKVNELTTENYRLSKEIESFKPVALGLFLKQQSFSNF